MPAEQGRMCQMESGSGLLPDRPVPAGLREQPKQISSLPLVGGEVGQESI
jgi:hypothetical protein